MTRTCRWGISGLIALVVLAGLFAERARLLPLTYRWLDVGETPEQADCVLVLGGGENVRPFVAASLVRAGLARRVLVTHVGDTPESEAKIFPPPHEINRLVLIRRGVEERDLVLIGRNLTTTFDEAQALREYLKTAPASRVLVVTNDCHTRRARWIFRQVLGDSEDSVVFVSAPTDGFDAENWWQTSSGFQFVVSEYCKLAFYGVWYGWWGYGIAVISFLACLTWGWHRWRRNSSSPKHIENGETPPVSESASPAT